MSLPIGGFMPLPLPMMIPFMAAQSAAMAQAFGTYFQYGKRKISSMSNEEFNKLTAQSMHETLTADIRAIIPSLAESMHTYDSSMTPQIIKEFSQIAKSAISESTTQVVKTIGGGLELGVKTSEGQINDFIAALTTMLTGINSGNNQNFSPGTTVQQTNVSVKDITLEQQTNPKLAIDEAEKLRLEKEKAAIEKQQAVVKSTQTSTTTQFNKYVHELELLQLAASQAKGKKQQMNNFMIKNNLQNDRSHVLSLSTLTKRHNVAVSELMKRIIRYKNERNNHLILNDARQKYNNRFWKRFE